MESYYYWLIAALITLVPALVIAYDRRRFDNKTAHNAWTAFFTTATAGFSVVAWQEYDPRISNAIAAHGATIGSVFLFIVGIFVMLGGYWVFSTRDDDSAGDSILDILISMVVMMIGIILVATGIYIS